MFGVLLEYIAKNPKGKGKPKVAFFYSDTEFGKDPIPYAKKRAGELGIDVVAEVVTKVGAVDVTTEVLALKKAQPDYVIFQGFVLAPIPEVIRATKDFGLKTRFMGTFWSMDKTIIDKLGGQVWLRSPSSGGNMITICLPTFADQNAANAASIDGSSMKS